MGNSISSIDNLKIEIDKTFTILIDNLMVIKNSVAGRNGVLKNECMENIQTAKKAFNSG